MPGEDEDDFEFTVGDDDAIVIEEPETEPGPEGTRQERRLARGRDLGHVDAELAELRRQREADRADLADLRAGLARAPQEFARQIQQPGKSEIQTQLEKLDAREDDLESVYAARLRDKDRPMTEEERIEFRKKGRALDHERVRLTAMDVQRASAPDPSKVRQEALNQQLREEFRELYVGSDKANKALMVATSEFTAALARGKLNNVETARDVMRKAAVEFGLAAPPPPSEAERRSGAGVRSQGTRTGSTTVKVKSGSPEYELAIRWADNVPSVRNKSEREKVAHWVRATGYRGENAQ